MSSGFQSVPVTLGGENVNCGLNIDAKVEIDSMGLLLTINHIGQTSIYRQNEVLFTNDWKEFMNGEEFCKGGDFSEVEERLRNHIQSIGFFVQQQKLVPILASTRPLYVRH